MIHNHKGTKNYWDYQLLQRLSYPELRFVGYEDPRLSAYFQPVDESCNYGIEAFDGEKYQGVPLGHTKGQNSTYENTSVH